MSPIRHNNNALLAGITACSLAGLAFMPALAQPNVHVYPGAQPIHQAEQDGSQSSSTTTATKATSTEPSSSSTAESPSTSASTDSSATTTTESNSTGMVEDSPATLNPTGADPAELEAQEQTLAGQHYQLATHYFKKWDFDLAEIEFDETVSIYPNYRIAHRDMCILALLKFDLPRSLAEFMMVTGLADPVEYNSKDKKELDNKAMHAHYRKGLKYGGTGTWNEAITELMWAQQYAPTDPAIHHSLAFAYGCTGDFQKAEEEYKLTFAAQPNDGLAHADFADFLADHGQIDKAEQEMREAVKLTPNAAALHVDLGWLAESKNEIADATNEFEQAVKLSPEHAGLWTHLGKLLEKDGKLAEAQDAYKHALAVNGDYTEAQQRLKAVSDELAKPKTQAEG